MKCPECGSKRVIRDQRFEYVQYLCQACKHQWIKGGEAMKCPLFILNDRRAQSGEETGIGDCLKEECAWWIEYLPPDGEQHAACALVHIADRLFAMVVKIPHKEELH